MIVQIREEREKWGGPVERLFGPVFRCGHAAHAVVDYTTTNNAPFVYSVMRQLHKHARCVEKNEQPQAHALGGAGPWSETTTSDSPRCQTRWASRRGAMTMPAGSLASPAAT